MPILEEDTLEFPEEQVFNTYSNEELENVTINRYTNNFDIKCYISCLLALLIIIGILIISSFVNDDTIDYPLIYCILILGLLLILIFFIVVFCYKKREEPYYVFPSQIL